MQQEKRWIVVVMDYSSPMDDEYICSFSSMSDAMDYMCSAYSRELEFMHGPEDQYRSNFYCFSEQIVELYKKQRADCNHILKAYEDE